MLALVDLGFYIGINGCSLRSPDSCDMVRAIPEEFLIIGKTIPIFFDFCFVLDSHNFNSLISCWDDFYDNS